MSRAARSYGNAQERLVSKTQPGKIEVLMTSPINEFFSVWRVNMRTKVYTREQVPQSWEALGGRSLLARILVDEVPPGCEPLGPLNKLIFAPGLLVGHTLSSSDRISIGGKSPLTGGVKEANAGGRTGYQLAKLGIKSLIIEDRPEGDGWWLLHLSADGVRFEAADEWAGMNVNQAAPLLIDRYGDKVAIALIGSSGERLLLAAGIQNLDKDKSPTRIAARGGLGALMGSKKLKAIIVDGSGGERPPLADPEAFKQARKDYTKSLLDHPQTQTYIDYGTAAMTLFCDNFGALPTRNFSAGSFEGAEKISGETMRSNLLERGGECDTSHACMAGCTIKSSNVYGDKNGERIVSPVEYETIGMMGSNLGIDDLDIIARMNAGANDMGIDSIELGGALGVAAEAGLMQFGDGQRALELIEEIRQDTPLGRILGHGAAMTGKVFGVERVPVVKNQALSAYDPRATKGTGVTYATSPQGADHTAGLTIRAQVDQTSPDGQVALSRAAQYKMAGYDSLGTCVFAGFGVSLTPEVLSQLLNARYGWETTVDIVEELGRVSLKAELDFNRKAGLSPADDRLPEWMTREELPPLNSIFDVSNDEMDHIFDELEELSGFEGRFQQDLLQRG
jgi:aldehyde:ferredoxin oxidoreductase